MHNLTMWALSIFLISSPCSAELLKVSADGTVFLSTDSLDVRQNADGKYVAGLIYVTEDGERKVSTFTASCTRSGGNISFQNPNQTSTKLHAWSINGKSVFDSISISACKLAHLIN